ncbi:hypothetical protein NECID01_1532 [Nematocida sp. AWRm77]|nr:hypothetical protein NECID01_1532 [Nematocida sp. AWRm77]
MRQGRGKAFDKSIKQREAQKNEALGELYRNNPSLEQEEKSRSAHLSPQQKRTNRMEQIHAENIAKQEEKRQLYEEIEARKQEKLRRRKEWTRKFSQRTKKGQIPLDHRINFTFRKIKALKTAQSTNKPFIQSTNKPFR